MSHARRMLFVHAHPDDETIATGGTIARYVAEGVEVFVLTCTLGEEGEVIGERWAALAADAADQLGGYRIGELTTALGHLDVTHGPRFLGGAGRWRDSGMAGTPAADHPRAFASAGEAEVVAALVAVLEDFRPHVVVTYDPGGGYGHPDHVRAHGVTMAAVDGAGSWAVPKVYWTVTERTALYDAIATMGDLPRGWRAPGVGELPSVPSVDAVIDVRAVLDAKRAALRAYATQITVAPSGTEFALSNLVAQPVLDHEHFVLARGTAGTVAGHERDLFAGIDDPR